MDRLDSFGDDNNDPMVIIGTVIGCVLLIVCCVVCVVCWRKRKRNKILTKIADNLSYQTFDANESMSTHNAANYVDNEHEAASIAANTLLENVKESQESHSQTSFKEVRQFEIKQWELRIDPTSKMRLLYNRIEHKNYWAWQYPKVAKTLGVEIPKKKIFKNANSDDPDLEMANPENKLMPPPPPPPPMDAIDIDAIPCAPTDDNIGDNDDEYEYYYEEENINDNVDRNKAVPCNPTDDNN